MFKNTGGMSGFRLLAVAGALMLGGCGGAELAPAELTGEEPTGVARQAMQACDYCGSMSAYANQIGSTIPCFCTASKATTNSSLWGTDIYTHDSSVCRAAVHAGAITTSGGFVAVTMLPGNTTYTGSTRNGVTSNSYYNPSWPASFSVASSGECALPCPTHLTSYRGQNGKVVSCSCTTSAINATNAYRTVFGTDLYTDDSSVCYAAIHAGVITTSGGVVNAVIAPAEAQYMGSLRNGVDSYNWDNTPNYTYGSYYFQ